MRQLATVPTSSSYAEEAHQLLVKILYIHRSRHAVPAALSRDALTLAIHSFPHNTMFLSLFLFGELGNRVYGRVQKLIHDISTSDNAGVVGHLWAVWAESMTSHRTFWDMGGGGAERVRNALDRGINSRAGRFSVPLWKLYVEFETHMGRYTSAKSLCYRAVSAIGGCKGVWLHLRLLRSLLMPRALSLTIFEGTAPSFLGLRTAHLGRFDDGTRNTDEDTLRSLL